MSNYVVVTIDGPSCSGKSTIARNLAKSLGFVHLNSGALYRAVALFALRRGYDIESKELSKGGLAEGNGNSCDVIADTLCRLAKSLNFEFRPASKRNISEGRNTHEGCEVVDGKCVCASGEMTLFVDGVDEGGNLYTPQISQATSKISVYAQLRDVLTQVQREMAKAVPVVLEGRDAGTVVFPNAPYKYYLDADLEVRASRRLTQLESSGISGLSLEEVKSELQQRDERDMTRSVTPLSKAADAKVLDTSSLTEKEVIELIKKDVLCSSS